MAPQEPPQQRGRLVTAIAFVSQALLFSIFLIYRTTSQAEEVQPAPVSMHSRAQPEPQHHLYEGPTHSLHKCQRDLWGPGAWFGNSTDSGRELAGTSYAQELIYRHQHPQDCSNKKFYVYQPHMTGIGSQLHMMTAFLGAAMELDRIFLEAFNSDWGTTYTAGSYCEADSQRLDECFYQPFSNCTLEDAGWNGTATAWVHDTDQSAIKTITKKGTSGWFTAESRVIPRAFQGLLALTRIPQRKHYYWWRAQGIAYLMRPNNRTLGKLEELRQERFGRDIDPGTISVHVRHGDKFIETDLVQDNVYWDLAKRIRQNVTSLQPVIFLSTEDPNTIYFFGNATASEGGGWQLLYTDTPRKPNSEIGAMNTTNLRSTMDFAYQFGPPNEYLWSLLNLDLALKADAWIGTISSNWCRLIDELRSTLRCKADNLYWDAQQPHPPEDLSW